MKDFWDGYDDGMSMARDARRAKRFISLYNGLYNTADVRGEKNVIDDLVSLPLSRKNLFEDYLLEWTLRGRSGDWRMVGYVPLQECVDRLLEWLQIFEDLNDERMLEWCRRGRHRRLFDHRLTFLKRKNAMPFGFEIEADDADVKPFYDLLIENEREMKPWSSFWDRGTMKAHLVFSDEQDAIFARLSF